MSLLEKLYAPKKHSNLIGEKIKAIRNQKNILAKDLSSACNVSVNTIHNYEAGIRQPSDENLKIIANRLGVNVAALYDRRINTCVDAMHILFELAGAFDLIPDKPFAGAPPVLITKDDTLKEAIRAWYNKRKAYNEKAISAEELNEWERSFPNQYSEELPHGEETFLNGYDKAMVLRMALRQIKLTTQEQIDQISKLLDVQDIIQAKNKLEFLQNMIESIVATNTP